MHVHDVARSVLDVSQTVVDVGFTVGNEGGFDRRRGVCTEGCVFDQGEYKEEGGSPLSLR